MPIVAVDEYRYASLRENQIWMSRDVRMDSVAEASSMQLTPEQHLRHSVAITDRAHDAGRDRRDRGSCIAPHALVSQALPHVVDAQTTSSVKLYE